MPLLVKSFQCLVCNRLGAPRTLWQDRVVVAVTAEVLLLKYGMRRFPPPQVSHLLIVEVLDREHPVHDGLAAVVTLGQHGSSIASLAVGPAVLIVEQLEVFTRICILLANGT